MDALLKALEGSSYKVDVTKALSREDADRAQYTDTPSNVTRVFVSGEGIQFGIFEADSYPRDRGASEGHERAGPPILDALKSSGRSIRA